MEQKQPEKFVKEENNKKEKTETINKGDFVELDYVAKLKDGTLFDSNKEEEIRKLNPNLKNQAIENNVKIFCIGQKMLLESLEENLLEKEIPGKYKFEIPAEKAFGLRDSGLVKILPSKLFLQQKVMPQPGMVFSIDSMLVKILSVSGGRVAVDFNSPLAGKDVVYEVDVKRKVTDEKEKISSLILYFFKKKIDFEIKDKKVILKEDSPFIALVRDKFKEILDMDLKSEAEAEKKKKSEEKKPEENPENKQENTEKPK